MDYIGIMLILVQLVGYKQVIHANFIDQLRQAKYGSVNNNQIDKIVLRPEAGLSGGIVPKEQPVIPAGLKENDTPQNTVCADIVFANDASCSLNNKVQTDQVDLIVTIASTLNLDEGKVRVGAFSYGQYVDNETKTEYLPGASRSTILAGLNNIARNLDRCRTIPYRAMSESMSYFKGKNDRDDKLYKDVLIFIGDGWTSPIRTRKHNAVEARKLRKAGVDILWIKTPAKNGLDEIKTIKNNGTAFDVEILPIVKNMDKIFNYESGDSEIVVKQVTDYLASRYYCQGGEQ
ncbi:unnamed protein product [Owenia fusiformis]|uniref:Uncharacterized protein n=1 Tax=Owenia fusiformis TaxID=6347 RepID=A0A8J1UT48_OWEFU|nr:unnamed protein product [Owenia fusiformis]